MGAFSRTSTVAALVATSVLAACSDGMIGDPSTGDPVVTVAPPDFLPAESGMKRLTQAQYFNMLEDLFGPGLLITTSLEPDVSINGFQSVGAATTTVSNRGIEQYEEAAYQVAEQVMDPGPLRDSLVPCTPAGPVDDACAAEVVSALGRRAFRRALTAEEVAETVAVVADAGSVLGDFYDGLEFGIAALLLSPHFVFRQELGEPDPTGAAPLRYSQLELATRLAFFLTNTGPDEELLSAAEMGLLDTDAGIAEQADRLLDSDGARAAIRNFFTEMYRLHLLDDLSKDPTVFVHMNPEVGPSAREETLRGIEHLVFDLDADYRELFTTRQTFVNRNLAAIYSVPTTATGEQFVSTTLPEGGPRRGLLGQVSILALNAHPVRTSPTLRGKFVRTVLLCEDIPPPPANISTAIPEPSPDALTVRDRVEAHLESPVCAGCHLMMDPIGLGLENFDALGRFRTTDNTVFIDASGVIDGVPYFGPAELGEVVAGHPRLGPCLVRNLYRYATGHVETPGETRVLLDLASTFEASGFRVQSLMREIALSEGFRTARAPEGYTPGGTP